MTTSDCTTARAHDLLWVLGIGAATVAYSMISGELGSVVQLLYLTAFTAIAIWRTSGFVPTRAAFWVLGYTWFSTVVRGLSLSAGYQPDAAIYRLVGSGPQLDEQLSRTVQLNLIAIAAFVVGYALLSRRRPRRRVLDRDVPRRKFGGAGWTAPALLLGLSLALIPVQMQIKARDEITSGGTFILDLPGLVTVGVSVALAARAGAGKKVATLVLASFAAYNLIILVFNGVKFGILAMALGGVIGFFTRPSLNGGGRRARPVLGTVVFGAATFFSLLVFSIPVFSQSTTHVSVGERADAGLAAVVSRSYGADAEIASRVWMEHETNPYLYGSSFAGVAYSWIPRQLWPGKPKSFSEWFGQEVFSFSPQSGTRFFSPSYTGEWLLNFGPIGVVIGWVLFGLGTRACDQLADIGLRAVLLIGLTHMVEGGLVTQFWLSAPLVLGAYLVSRLTSHEFRSQKSAATARDTRDRVAP